MFRSRGDLSFWLFELPAPTIGVAAAQVDRVGATGWSEALASGWQLRDGGGATAMITTAEQYQLAQEELRQLEERLRRLQQSHPPAAEGFTKAGIRKMIARLHEELALYEGSQEVGQVDS